MDYFDIINTEKLSEEFYQFQGILELFYSRVKGAFYYENIKKQLLTALKTITSLHIYSKKSKDLIVELLKCYTKILIVNYHYEKNGFSFDKIDPKKKRYHEIIYTGNSLLPYSDFSFTLEVGNILSYSLKKDNITVYGSVSSKRTDKDLRFFWLLLVLFDLENMGNPKINPDGISADDELPADD